MSAPAIGILALQGAFAEHAACLEALGARTREIRQRGDLDSLDGLVLPGGESTTQARLAQRGGLTEPLRALIAAGLPTLGTCAGLILLASHIEGEGAGLLASLPVTVRRNAYGRQLGSFVGAGECGDETCAMTFIRAPRIIDPGDADVVARLDGAPVGVRAGSVTGLAFHPELGADLRFHRWLIAESRS